MLAYQLEDTTDTTILTDSQGAIDIITRATSRDDPISILAISTYDSVRRARRITIEHVKGH
eukprot:1432873-Pyramimonas_sp.AAC.1